jgi:hypothetical protein
MVFVGASELALDAGAAEPLAVALPDALAEEGDEAGVAPPPS